MASRRIGILSDTHSVDDPRIAYHFRDVDEVWHAGDIGDVDTYRALESIAPVFRAVSGSIEARCCAGYAPSCSFLRPQVPKSS